MALSTGSKWKIAATSFAVATTYCIYYIYKRREESALRKLLPPGPGPAADVAIFEKGKISLAKLRELQKKYGDIFHVQVGDKLLIFLSTPSLIREAFIAFGEVCSSRPRSSLRDYVTRGCGILHSSGEVWKFNRRLTLNSLRDFGIGSSASEKIILAELEFLLAEISEHAGPPATQQDLENLPEAFDIQPLLTKAVLNVISTIVFGSRLTTDKRFSEILPSFLGLFGATVAMNPKLARFWRLFLYVPGDPVGLKRYFANHEAVWRVISSIVEEHERTLDPSAPRDLVDAYLINTRLDRDGQVVKRDSLSDFNVVRLVWEMFIAATESTSYTLYWSIYLLTKHLSVQQAVQANLDRVLGESERERRLPAFSDRTALRFTHAALRECERYASSTPIALPHQVDRDVHLSVGEDDMKKTYRVPAGSLIHPNIHAVHYDPRWWPAPDKFDVANCYDASTGALRAGIGELLIPFGVGRRSCLGEALAGQELFLFFAGMFQRFEFLVHPAHQLAEVDQNLSPLPARHPPAFRICVRRRC